MADAARSLLLKIDGVASAGEAEALQAAGANVIGITVATGRDDDPPRCVTPAMALAIRDVLTASRLCVTIDSEAETAEAALAALRALSADMIQVPPHSLARDEWREAIEAEDLPVVLDGEEISYEDDPAFIAQRLGHAADWTSPLFQVALLPDMKAPWTHLQTEAPQHPDDYIQLADIVTASETYDLLVSMDVSPADVRALIEALPAIRGFVIVLGTKGLDPALALLRALHSPST